MFKQINFERVLEELEAKNCLQRQSVIFLFFLIFMSSLTAGILKNSHVFAEIDIFFLENALSKTWKAFNTKFRAQLKKSLK